MQKKDRTKKADLVGQKRQLEIQLNQNKERIKELQREGTALMGSLTMVDDQIRNFEGICDLQVTDHAVCRYLERFKGINIEAARYELASIAIKGKIMDGIKDWKAFTGEHKIVVKDNSVITVMERK